MHAAYAVQLIEYERGWGQRPDGYYIFNSKSSADAFINSEFSKRTAGPVPDYYINYRGIGLQECSLAFDALLCSAPRGFLYVDDLDEMLWNAEQLENRYRHKPVSV